MPTTATSTRTEGGESRQTVPVFRTQEVDTEEDEIEKKMDEGGKEEENKLHHSRKLPFGPLLSRYCSMLIRNISLSTLHSLSQHFDHYVVPFLRESYPEKCHQLQKSSDIRK